MDSSKTEEAVIVIKELAEFYESKRREFEKHFDVNGVDFDTVRELEARCNILTDQFRVFQQKLIYSLEEEDLDSFVKISKMFDELRILYLVAIDSLRNKVSQGNG